MASSTAIDSYDTGGAHVDLTYCDSINPFKVDLLRVTGRS